MGFDGLLGNHRLKENLRGSLARGQASHFYLISGPLGSGKHTLAGLLSAALVCTGAEKPCLHCGPCRKAMQGLHPDLITVDDPTKKTVPVELVRDARADIYIQPNEVDRKVYIFPRAQDMLPPAQNALLKVLEEPPKYGVFILLTDNPDKLLPTVRSRCVELALTALPREILVPALRREFPEASAETLEAAVARSGGFLGQAREILAGHASAAPQTGGFADAFARRDALALVQTLTPMEKLKRDTLVPLLDEWTALLTGALASRSGVPAADPLAESVAAARNSREIAAAIDEIRKCAAYARENNVSPAAVCGYLAHALRR